MVCRQTAHKRPMIFLNDRKLARQLRDGQVTERQQLHYYLIFTIIFTIFTTMTWAQNVASPAPLTIYDYLNDAAYVLFSLTTVILCYRINARGDGRSFIARYISLSFPVSIQTFLVSIIPGITATILDNPALLTPQTEGGGEPVIVLGGFTLAATAMLLLYYIYRMTTAFRIAAAGQHTPTPAIANHPAILVPSVPSVRFAPAASPLQHLRNTVRATFVRPVMADGFNGSWHALLIGIAIYIACRIAIDFFYIDLPRNFSVYAFQDQAGPIVTLLFGIYLTCLLYRKVDRMTALAAATIWVLLIPAVTTFAIMESEHAYSYSTEVRQGIMALVTLWVYIALFALIGVFLGFDPLRQIAGAAIVVICLAAPYNNAYQRDFWYTTSNDNTDETSLDKTTHDRLFSIQPALIAQKIASIPESRPGVTDMYGLIIGSYGEQDVFMHEAAFVGQTLEDTLGMKDRTIALVNNPMTVNTVPLATTLNMEAALQGLAARMQPEDILFLYMTSHGSADDGLSVVLQYPLRLDQLSAERVQKILDASAIQNRVIVISACFSGAMIDRLKTDHSLIMTAAAADKPSFGCGDDSDLTYFADAYFKQALPAERNLVKAFAIARAYIAQRETEENITPASNPQIYIGPAIEDALRRYKPTASRAAD